MLHVLRRKQVLACAASRILPCAQLVVQLARLSSQLLDRLLRHAVGPELRGIDAAARVQRTGAVGGEPLDKFLALVGATILGQHGIYHELLRDGAEQVLGDLGGLKTLGSIVTRRRGRR